MKCSCPTSSYINLGKSTRMFISKTDSKITSEVFIKYIARNYLGIDQEDLTIKKNDYGKPYLLDYPNIHYNVSHTKGIIVCVISNECVGIDIERVRTFNRRILKKSFTVNEQSYILRKEEGQDRRFFETWTRKEAYVKWIGKGLEIPLNSFDVIDDTRIVTIYIDDYIVSICRNTIIDELKFKTYSINLEYI